MLIRPFTSTRPWPYSWTSIAAALGLTTVVALTACDSDSEPEPNVTTGGGGEGGTIPVAGGAAGGGSAGTGGSGATGGAAGAGGSGGQATVEVATTEQALDTGAHGAIHSPAVAVAPNGLIAVVWSGYVSGSQRWRLAYRFSVDGGLTWEGMRVLAPYFDHQIEPRLGVDAASNFYLVWQEYVHGPPTNKSAFVGYAHPGETEFVFGQFLEALDSVDDVSLTTALPHRIYVPYMNLSSDQLQYKRWSGSGYDEHLLRDGWYREPHMCIDAGTGRVYAAYLDSFTVGLDSYRTLKISWSANGTPPWTHLSYDIDAGNVVLTTRPTCVAGGGKLWVSYGAKQDAITGDAAEHVRVAAFDDMDNPPTLHDAEDAAAGPVFMWPAMALGPTALDLVYYAGPTQYGAGASLRRAWSADEAVSWTSPSLEVHSGMELTPQPYQGGMSKPCLWVAGDMLVGAYNDNSSGTSKLRYFATPSGTN